MAWSVRWWELPMIVYSTHARNYYFCAHRLCKRK
jgi:hypothetical protein